MTEAKTEKAPTPLDLNSGDHERFTHYVLTTELEKAIFNGTPCTALCGKKWLPHKDPNKFPLCPMCKEKYEALEG